MIELFKQRTKINFVRWFIPCGIVSTIMCVAVLVFLPTKLNYGVDFRGGAEIQVKFQEGVSLEKIRTTLESDQFKGVTAQTVGDPADHEVLIKVQAEEEELNPITAAIGQSLSKHFASSGPEIRQQDIVGPKAGEHLRLSGILAMAWALVAIMIYVAIRFQFKFCVGAIVATIHDCFSILAVYMLTGTEFTLQTVAALLAVIGYSVNDTVVIYDRIREHEAKYPGIPFKQHINNALNETLSRTVITSLSTLFVCIVMYFFGGIVLKDFFLALIVGIISGCYSTIYISSPITSFFHNLQHPEEKKLAKA